METMAALFIIAFFLTPFLLATYMVQYGHIEWWIAAIISYVIYLFFSKMIAD
jgi:hypothetical protein